MTKALPKTNRTCTVASRLDHDVVLHVDAMQNVRVTGQFGSVVEEQYSPGTGDKAVMIFGKQRPRGEVPEGYKVPEMMNGCALTRGVDAELWDAWKEQVLKGPGIGDAIRNGLLSAYGDEPSLRDGTKDQKDVLSGLGPLDPKNDPRLPKPLNSSVGRIEIADRTA
jgi:hypothetical protein